LYPALSQITSGKLELPPPSFCVMSLLSVGPGAVQASLVPVLSDSDIRNVATDAIRNAAALNLDQGFELAEAFLRGAESSVRLTQVLLIEFNSGDDEKRRANLCTNPFRQLFLHS
jgi:hypothetical protein